jgi:hypothetical protein
MDKLATHKSQKRYIQHNPAVADGLRELWEAAMKYLPKTGWSWNTQVHKDFGTRQLCFGYESRRTNDLKKTVPPIMIYLDSKTGK